MKCFNPHVVEGGLLDNRSALSSLQVFGRCVIGVAGRNIFQSGLTRKLRLDASGGATSILRLG